MKRVRNKLILWCQDLSPLTGEGNLARNFLKNLNKQYNVKIIKNFSNNFFSKYLYFFLNLPKIWFFYLKGINVGFVNYLPLWNSFIFFLVPRKFIYGPITCSLCLNKSNSFQFLIRKYLLPLLYQLSFFFLKRKKTNFLFATNIAKKFILKDSPNFFYNFVLKDFKFKKKTFQKKFDYIIYYKKHNNKFFQHHYIFIYEELLKSKKVVAIGDYLNIKNVKNYGYVSPQKTSRLIAKSKYCISGDDNLFSFFNLKCLSYKLTIIFNYKLMFQNEFFKKKYFKPYDFIKKKFIKKEYKFRTSLKKNNLLIDRFFNNLK